MTLWLQTTWRSLPQGWNLIWFLSKASNTNNHCWNMNWKIMQGLNMNRLLQPSWEKMYNSHKTGTWTDHYFLQTTAVGTCGPSTHVPGPSALELFGWGKGIEMDGGGSTNSCRGLWQAFSPNLKPLSHTLKINSKICLCVFGWPFFMLG